MNFRIPPPLEAAPQNGQGWGLEFGAAVPRQRTGPACSRKVMNVCVPASCLPLGVMQAIMA